MNEDFHHVVIFVAKSMLECSHITTAMLFLLKMGILILI